MSTLTLTPDPASATFTGAAASWTLQLHPSTVAAAFTGLPAALKLTLHPVTVAAVFTGRSVTLKLTVRPSTGAAAFTAGQPGLTLQLHPATAAAMVFTAGTAGLTWTFGTAPALFALAGGAALVTNLGVFDIQRCLTDIWYRLGFLSEAELDASTLITTTELYQWADEAAKKLAYETGMFTGYDDTIPVAAGTALYNLPAAHVFTLFAWMVYSNGLQLLRMTPVRDLWALDAQWTVTVGDPQRASLDAGSVGTLTLYPNPIQDGTLAQIYQQFPPELTAATPALYLVDRAPLPLTGPEAAVTHSGAPPILQDYFSYKLLAEARGKEGELAQLEMSEHYKQRCALYEQIIQQYYGPGQ